MENGLITKLKPIRHRVVDSDEFSKEELISFGIKHTEDIFADYVEIPTEIQIREVSWFVTSEVKRNLKGSAKRGPKPKDTVIRDDENMKGDLAFYTAKYGQVSFLFKPLGEKAILYDSNCNVIWPLGDTMKMLRRGEDLLTHKTYYSHIRKGQFFVF